MPVFFAIQIPTSWDHWDPSILSTQPKSLIERATSTEQSPITLSKNDANQKKCSVWNFSRTTVFYHQLYENTNSLTQADRTLFFSCLNLIFENALFKLVLTIQNDNRFFSTIFTGRTISNLALRSVDNTDKRIFQTDQISQQGTLPGTVVTLKHL